MDHSYEEIRAAAIDVLAGREKTTYPPEQYQNLSLGVAEVVLRRQFGANEVMAQTQRGATPHLSGLDAGLFLEVFWDLFRQGIITLGLNDANREFPWFRVSRAGHNILANQGGYFFHDVSTYHKVITDQIPQIDEVTLLYLQEAMQAFHSGCLLSATVMLGVAAEHTFYLLLDIVEGSATHHATFRSVFAERTVLQRFNKFKNILDQQLRSLPPEVKEDLDTHFAGILSVVRAFRNQSGHPTGKIMEREQVFILLQLFIPYCKKMYQLMDYFR